MQKHLDAFASAFGFFLIGFDYISYYSTPRELFISRAFFQVTDPMLWFFKVHTIMVGELVGMLNNMILQLFNTERNFETLTAQIIHACILIYP